MARLFVAMIVIVIAALAQAAEPYVSTGFLPLPSDIQIGAMSAVAVDGPDTS